MNTGSIVWPRVNSLQGSEAQLERWRCGRIVTADGQLKFVERRLLGYRASVARVAWDKVRRSMRRVECELFYHHGWFSSDFLVLGYVRSHPQASLTSFYCATLVLDEIARLKGSHAIVTEVSNSRLSDRLLARWGWEQHCLNWSGRHFIKRFYGKYPALPNAWRERLYGAWLSSHHISVRANSCSSDKKIGGRPFERAHDHGLP